MKKFLFLLIAMVGMGYAPSSVKEEGFIATYKDLAITEMQRTGIPASITMAQAIIESACGTSELAVRGNNFFGIKYKPGWHGGSMLHNDDRKNERFRVYPDADSSFRDHSYFLTAGTNYRFLFALPKTDFRSWAKGLQQAGYATEKNYAKTLIRCIETYHLDTLDYYDSKGIYGHWPTNGHP